MNKNPLSVGICVPSNRKSSIHDFFKHWIRVLSSDIQDKYRVTLFLHEDRPEKSFDVGKWTQLKVIYTSQADIDKILGKNGWIIPRGSGACRSFPMYLAWKSGCDYIITMDDDCFPDENYGIDFIDTHLAAFRMDRWFRTISGNEPRGIPYGNRGHLPVLLNHGLWKGAPDLDAPMSLIAKRNGINVTLRATREVIPPGMWFTLCAMNVCYHRNTIPAAYNLLMGIEEVGFDRFDDIWSGLLLKRIADHLGFYITNGIPFVNHSRASNPFINLRKEAAGIEIHENFWQHISRASFQKEKTIIECYRCLANWVQKFPVMQPSASRYKEYFEKLGEAMHCWLKLFSNA